MVGRLDRAPSRTASPLEAMSQTTSMTARPKVRRVKAPDASRASCELQTNGGLKRQLNARADKIATQLPPGIARPALRALDRSGISRLEDLTAFTEAEIAALHGMGPKALSILRAALAARGKSFRT